MKRPVVAGSPAAERLASACSVVVFGGPLRVAFKSANPSATGGARAVLLRLYSLPDSRPTACGSTFATHTSNSPPATVSYRGNREKRKPIRISTTARARAAAGKSACVPGLHGRAALSTRCAAEPSGASPAASSFCASESGVGPPAAAAARRQSLRINVETLLGRVC